MTANADAFSYRVVQGAERTVFSQYLLPDAARLLWNGQGDLLLGAVSGITACGAAALRFPPPAPGAGNAQEALLVSLFIDPLARRRGAGTGLVRLALDCAQAHGAALLRANYVGGEADVAALDAFFRALGAEPEFRLPVYEADSGRFHDSRLVKRAFSWDYRKPGYIVPFFQLDGEQLAHLELDPELPFYVDPARRPNMLPELSLAYLDGGGTVIGFWLGSASAMDRFSVQGIWHNSRAPASCFHELLLAHLNLCYYRGGGDFLYYVSPAVEFADKLIQTYTGGVYRRLEEHTVALEPGQSCQRNV